MNNLYTWNFEDVDYFSDKMLELATKSHEGQYRLYGDNLPYITHPIAVSKIAGEKWKFTSPQCFINIELGIIKSISYCHDIVEDCPVSYDDISNYMETIGVYKPIGDRILTAIRLLTKKKEGFDLIEYLNGIKCNQYALIVKLSDLDHNMSNLKDQKKLDYYKLINYYLMH